MNILSSAAASGIWPVLVITGLWALWKSGWWDEDKSYPFPLTLGLCFALGMAVWSIPMLLSAILKIYYPVFWGTAGWVLTGVAVFFWEKKGYRQGISLKIKNIWSWILLLGLAAASFFYIYFPNESIRGGNDMGTYTNAGIYIVDMVGIG